MHKIIFKNSEAGIPEDWTQYLSDMSSISRRVESENAGEAGVIVYDNVSSVFEYKDSSPIFNAFNGDLSSIQRYIIEVYGIKTTGVEVKMFEGIVDFSSLEWPDLAKKISFDVLDKLSALDIIASELPRTESTLNSRILSQLPSAISLRSALLPTPYIFPSNCYELLIYAKDGNSDTLDFTEVIVNPGEYIQDPQTWGGEAKYYYVKSSYLELDDNNNMVNRIVLATPLYAEQDYLPLHTVEYLSNNSTHYLSKEFYGIDINIISGGDSQALDALKIIEAIFRKAWSTTPIINKTVNSTYPIPLEYAAKLIDENPFGKHPLDALKMLADSMQCYIYINRLGELVIQQKSLLATNGTTRTINDLNKKDGRKKYFWDKLADEIDITVNSWVIDEETGEYLQGIKTVSKNPKIKARNSISKEVLVIEDDGTPSTQDELNAIATTKATEYFNFYGRRHFAYPISLNLYDEILDWDLLDNITIDAEKYFFETLDIDPLEMTVDLELVSVNAYDYDSKQAHVIIGEGNESSYSSSGSASASTSSASVVVLNKKLTNLSQMDNNVGLVVQVSDYGFSKRSVVGMANQVSVANGDGVSGDITISLPQNIHTAAVPTFAGTKLTTLTPNRIISADADNNLVSTNASSWIAGTNNQITVADDGDGSVTISLPQDIHTAATPTFAGAVLNGNVSVDGNLSVSSLTQNRIVSADSSNNLISTDLSNWIAGTNNQISVADDGDGSVTLSLPQDIHTTAAPQFGSLGLGGSPLSGYAVSIYSNAIGTNNFVSETTGWNIDYSGNADLRKIYADEMRVKAFTADIEQALAGSDILAKSVAILFENFTVPAVGASLTLKVEDLPGFNDMANFVSGDWIRLRIFDRTDGGLTVGDVWGTVSGYVSYQDGSQTWEFTTQSVSYPNLIGQSIYKGSIVLDYGTSGQGLIERTVLGEYAPYQQMMTWSGNPYTASNYSLGLRTGNLSGITDSDFGGSLSGYGMYATNVYLKGKLYATLGSNVAGWETTINQFKSPTIEVGASGVFATSYLDSATNNIGLHIGLDNGSNSNDEWISVGSILDKDGLVEVDTFGISYKSYLGTYFELTNSAKNIAGWSFDTEKFTKGEARLEASASINGLVISKLGTDFVRVGDFNYSGLDYSIRNMTDTYIGYNGIDYLNDVSASPYVDDTKWNTGAWITSSDEGFNGTNNTLAIYGTLDGQTNQINTAGRDRLYWWSYVLQRKFSGRESINPLSKLMGHRSRINYKLIFNDTNQNWETDGGDLNVFIRYYDSLGNIVQHILLESTSIPDTPIESSFTVDRTGTNASEIDFPFNADAEYAVLFFEFTGGGQQSSVEYNPLSMTIQDFSVNGYELYFTALNVNGLEIYNSPVNYFKFGEDRAELYATDLKIAGLRPTRFHGVLSSFPTNNVQVGDIFINSEITYVCSALDITGNALWKQLSASTSSGAYGLDNLSNANISAASTGQILKYDNGFWVNSSVEGGTGSGLDSDLLDGQHGTYYLDWNNTTNKPSPIITLNGDATGVITLTELAGGTLTVSVVNDSHTHDTQYSLLSHNHNTLYSVLGHTHDDQYFTETEITTNYYDKNYIDNNFITTTNQYDKWILTDGIASRDVVKDDTITFSGSNGVTTSLVGSTMTFGIATNTYADYVHNHDSVYSLLGHSHDDRYFTETEITTNYYDKTSLDSGQLDNRYYTETEVGNLFYTKSLLDAGQLDNRYYTETESDTLFISSGGGTFTGDIKVGLDTDSENRFAKVITGDGYIASLNAVGNSLGNGQLLVGRSIDYGGGIFVKGNIGITEPFTLNAVSFYRKNYTSLAEVFYYNVASEGVYFQEEIFAKGITASQRIASTVTTGTSPFTVASATLVNNLNADLWDGYHFLDYLNQGVRTTDNVTHASATLSGNLTFPTGENHFIQIGSDYSWWYKLASLNNDFRILDANEDIDFLRTKYNAGASTRSIELMNGSFILTALGVATFNNSVKSASVEPTNLTTNYFPYKSAASLVNSIISTDGIKIDVAGNISQSGNYSFYNNYISGILGTGFNLGQTVAGSNLEVDNITVRNSLRTHIFQKDVVKAISGIVSISESGVITYASVSTIKFLDSKSSSFVIDDVLWFKDVKDDGTILSVKFTITAVGSSVSGETDYTVSVTEGVLSTDMIGGTASRTSGGVIVLDASSTNSPYIDILRDGTLVSRFGNLAGIISPTFGQLAGDGIWTGRLYAENDVKIKGHLEATTGTIGGFTTDATKMFANTDIVIDAFNKRISLSNGAMGFGYDIGGANKHGLFIDANNYWYSDKNFSLGGANGISFDGTVILMGSDTKFLGNLSGNTITGTDLVVDATGAIRSSDYVEKEEGWRLSQDGFENNKMRLFELAEDMTAGTPIKLTYDGTTSKVAKLKASNLDELNGNEIYNDSYSFNERIYTASYNGDRYYQTVAIKLDENRTLHFEDSVSNYTKFGIIVISCDNEGKYLSSVVSEIPLPTYSYGLTYTVPNYAGLQKLSDTSFIMMFRINTGITGAGGAAVFFGILNIASDGTATLDNLSSAITVDVDSSGYVVYEDPNYPLYNFFFAAGDSMDSTHALSRFKHMLKIDGTTYTVIGTEIGGSFIQDNNCIRTSDGKIVTTTTNNGIKYSTLFSISGDVLSWTDTALLRTDWTTYRSNILRLSADKFVFSFMKAADSTLGIYVLSYSGGVITEGNAAGLDPDATSIFIISSSSLLTTKGAVINIIGLQPFFLFRIKNFISVTYPFKFLSYMYGGSLFSYTLEGVYNGATGFYDTWLRSNEAKVAKVTSSSGQDFPTYISNSHNKALRLGVSNNSTASDFVRLNTEKYLLCLWNKSTTDYLEVAVVERTETGYIYYAYRLTLATGTFGSISTIQKVSDTHFLVKNGSYIYLVKLVDTTLSLVDSYYNSGISTYDQEFAELIEGSRYAYMGSNSALIIDVLNDNLTVTSYATTTTTLIANIVGIGANQWVGAYPFNSSGYKATYRMYTFTGTAVTYVDLINTTLVSSTEKIVLAQVRDNLILAIAKLDTGNGIISLEEMYSTAAATQDSREYPSSLFTSVDKLSKLGGEGYGAILGNAIVHITITAGKINTRFATNVVNSTNTIDTRCITSASSGDMLLYCKGDFFEDDPINGGQDSIVIDVINDTYFVDGILEQGGNEGDVKKVALPGDETRVFTNLIPGTRYGISFKNVSEVVEEYDRELILALEDNKALII